MRKTFEELCSDGVCHVCGNKTKVIVCASKFGPVSNAYCKECLESDRESYFDIVGYTWAGGKWPESFREDYVEVVRANLIKLNISEEQFINDIKETEKSYIEYCQTHQEVIEESDVLSDLNEIMS